MLTAIVNGIKKFRDKIYHLSNNRQDATFELIDSLSSNTNAKSVIELSLNPLHRRNYCSTTRVLDEYYSKNIDKKIKNDALTKIFSEHVSVNEKRNFLLFGVDCTSNPRLYSPTQEDRGFVYSPTIISGNKPITIGHQYSIAAFLPEKSNLDSPPWILPLACHRVSTDENGPLIGMQQITQCIQSSDAFKEKLCVSVADSAYTNPDCLLESKKNPNQVHNSRARSNRKFYHPVKPDDQDGVKKGRKKRYGKAFHLNDATTHGDPDQREELITINKNGKAQKTVIESWDEMIMRGKKKKNVSDIFFRLTKICTYDENEKPLFKKPLWLTTLGERRFELTLPDIYYSYRQRFDLEHFFRFGKNRLLMDKSQTTDVNHEEAWWQLTMIAYAQLYLAHPIAKNSPNPWEKYLPEFKSSTREIAPTQVQKDFFSIIRTIGTPAQLPKHRKNAPGRQKGAIQIKRTRHAIVIKKKIAQPVAILV